MEPVLVDSAQKKKTSSSTVYCYYDFGLTGVSFCFTAFRAQIDAGVVAFDLNQQVASLMNISTELGMVTGPGEAEAMNLQSMVDDLIMQLENLNSTLIPTIQGQLASAKLAMYS